MDQLWEQNEQEVAKAVQLVKAHGGLKALYDHRAAIFPRFRFADPVGYYDTSISSINILLPFFESIVVPIYYPLNSETCTKWYGIELEHLLELTKMGVVNPLFDFNFNCGEFIDTISLFRPRYGEFKFKMFSILFNLLSDDEGLRTVRGVPLWEQYYEWIRDPLLAYLNVRNEKEFMLSCRSTYYPEQVLLSLLMLDFRPVVRQLETLTSPLWDLLKTRENYRLTFHFLSYFLIDPVLHPMFGQKVIDTSEIASLKALPRRLTRCAQLGGSNEIFLPTDVFAEFAGEYFCRLPEYVENPVNYKERLAKSDNVRHAHRALESFGREFGTGNPLDTVAKRTFAFREPLDELNKEISRIQKRSRITEAVLKIGASITSMVTGGLAAGALAGVDVSKVITYAGACAAALLLREESSKVAKFLQNPMRGRRTAFLIWKKTGV